MGGSSNFARPKLPTYRGCTVLAAAVCLSLANRDPQQHNRDFFPKQRCLLVQLNIDFRVRTLM